MADVIRRDRHGVVLRLRMPAMEYHELACLCRSWHSAIAEFRAGLNAALKNWTPPTGRESAMADVLGKNPRRVTLKVHVPSSAYDMFALSYPCEALALADLRQSLPSLLQVLIERRVQEQQASASASVPF